jgi:CO/xanthine dehydrogenase Mo-binding subunit
MSIAMSAAQAYANAICNAIGTWIHEFPMTPEVVLEAIERTQVANSEKQRRES